MKSTPPWSRMRWHQPDRRTCVPMSRSRSSLQVWVRYRCMALSWRKGRHVSPGRPRVKAPRPALQTPRAVDRDGLRKAVDLVGSEGLRVTPEVLREGARHEQRLGQGFVE